MVDEMTVPMSDDLMEELERVRSSGRTNMCDRIGEWLKSKRTVQEPTD